MKKFLIGNLLSFIALLNCPKAFGQSTGTVNSSWNLFGNTKTTNNFIGTKDTSALKFKVNNLEAMHINSSGNVGIGTVYPQRRLVATIANAGSLTAIALENTDTTARNASVLSYRSTLSNHGSIGENFIEFATINGIHFDHRNLTSAGGLSFSVRRRNNISSGEAMRIDSSLNVGIGTIHPAEKLHVAGRIYSDNGGFVFPDGSVQTTSAVNYLSSSNGWSLNGNSNIDGNNNFLGTIDAQDLRFKTDNVNSGLISVSNNNTAFGYNALGSSNGYGNTALGYQALAANQDGYENVAMGSNALTSNNVGFDNVAIGFGALANNMEGRGNVAVGANQNNYFPVYGAFNTFIGFNAGQMSDDFFNATAIGANAQVNWSNQVRIGDANVYDIGGYANWNNVSDKRLKNVTSDTVPGLTFILQLQPIQYYWKKDTTQEILHTGLLAQDVDSIAKSLHFNFDGVVVPKDISKSNYGIAYSQLIMPMIIAIKEQQAQINSLKKSLLNQH